MAADAIDGDPLNPATWHLGMLDAIAGIQSRDFTATTAYLQFVEKHRGRPVAEEAKARLSRLARTDAFANAAQLAADARTAMLPRSARPTAIAKPRRGRK